MCAYIDVYSEIYTYVSKYIQIHVYMQTQDTQQIYRIFSTGYKQLTYKAF